MKTYHLRFTEDDFFSKEGSKWRTPLVDLYYNEQYRNYSVKKSQFGSNLLGDNTYTGSEEISESQSEIGIVTEGNRFIDTSGRVDISAVSITISNTELTFPATISVFTHSDDDATPYYMDNDPDSVNDWLRTEHRNPKYPVLIVNADRYAFFEIDFNSDYSTSELQVELIVTIRIDSPTVNHYFDSTKKIQNKFPEWMAIREYNALDEERATPKTPESIGGKFINATLGEPLEDINKKLNLLIYNKFINTIDLDAKIWIYKASAVPQKIYAIYGIIDEDLVNLASSSSSAEFYESGISQDVYYHNTVTNEVYINKKYSAFYINNVEYPQTVHQLWHHLDDIGLGVDLFRLRNENNESFKKRILDVFINQPGITIQRFKNAIRRELNLWKYFGATPATPDSFALGATPEVLEIKDIENSLEYFVNKMPTQKFIDLIKEISINYPLIWGHLKTNQAIWDPDGVAHNDFGILPRQLDATPISSTYVDSGVIDGNDLFVFKPDQFTGSEVFNASLKLRGIKRTNIDIKPKVNFNIAIYGIGSYSTYTNPVVEENITIELTLNDNSKYYCNTVISASNLLNAQYPNGIGNSRSIIEWTTADGFTNAIYVFSEYKTSVPYSGRINLSNVNKIELKVGHFNGNAVNPIYTSKANINDFKLWFQYSDLEFIGKDMATPSTSIVLDNFSIALIYPSICFESFASYENSTPSSWKSPLVNNFNILLNNGAECRGTEEIAPIKKDFKLIIPDNIIWPSYVTDRQYAVEITSNISDSPSAMISDISEAYVLDYSINDLYVNNQNNWVNAIQLFDDSTSEIIFSYNKSLQIDVWDLFEASQTSPFVSGKVNQFGPWKNDEEPVSNDKDFFLTRLNISREDFDLINGEQAPADWIYSANYMVTWIGIDTVDNDAINVWLLGNSVYPLVHDGNNQIRAQVLDSQIEEKIEDDIYNYGVIPVFARLKPGINSKWNPKLHSGWFFDTDQTYYLYADASTENATNNHFVLPEINRLGAPIIIKAFDNSTPVLDMRQVSFYDNDATPELSIVNKEKFIGNGTNTFFTAYKDIYDISVSNLTFDEPVSIVINYSSTNKVTLTGISNADFTYQVSYKVKGSFFADNNYIDTDGKRKTKIVFDSTPQRYSADKYQINYETSVFDVATPVDISLNSLYSSIDESFIFIDKNTYDLSQIEVRASSSKILADGIDYILLTFRAIDVNGNPKPSASFNVYTNFGYLNPSSITTDSDGFGWSILKSEPWSTSLAPTPSHLSLTIPQIGSTPVQGTVLVDGDVDASISFQIDIPSDKQRYVAAVANPDQVSTNSPNAVFISGAVRNADHTPIPYAVVYWRKERTVNQLLSENILYQVETDLSESDPNNYGYVVADNLGYFSIGPFKPSTVAGYWFVSTQVGSASPNFSANQFSVIGDVVYWYEYPNSSIRDITQGAIQYSTPTDSIPDYSYSPLYPIGVDENTWSQTVENAPLAIPGSTPSRWGKAYLDLDDMTIRVDRPDLGVWLPPAWYAVDKFEQHQIGLNRLKSGTNEIGLDIVSATPLYPDYKEF